MVNMQLLDKLRKNSTVDTADIMSQSEIFTDQDSWNTDIPAINIALTGEIDGDYNPGLLTIAGQSKHFKSLFGLIVCGAYLKKNPDAAMLFYDSEKGAALNYVSAAGIDPSRILHTPIDTVEGLRHDVAAQMKEMKRGDKIITFVDSVGNLASSKETADAESGSDKADMTRAKALKSFGRIVTPHLVFKDLPMVIINHTYDELSLFPKQIMSGGQGIYLSSNDIWFIGRQQEKKGTELVGYNFIINIEKSRKVREKSKIPITVTQTNGLNKWSGLLDIALDGGFVTSEKKGYYVSKFGAGKSYRADDTNTADFWEPILKSQDFKNYVKYTYLLADGELLVREE